ncbi:MAG: hypothetical protein EBU03_05405, partial [Methylophilaceae bacterium]|nr:hypothetical protein [Methylophilaceae bacterium]
MTPIAFTPNALAADYNWTFTGTGGDVGKNGSGTFGTNSLNVITSISGNVSGFPAGNGQITALLPPNGYLGNDNKLFPNLATYLNGNGVSFEVGAVKWCFYYSIGIGSYRMTSTVAGNSGNGTMTLLLASTNVSNPLVNVNATTNTATNTNTAANLSGAVTVNIANGSAAYLLNRKMNIVSSTGLSGTFSGVTTSQNLSFLTPYLSYDANNVYLSYGLTPFSTVAKNINQRNVGNALTVAALGNVSSLGAPILNALFYGDYTNAQAVMDTVSGSGLAGVQSTAMQVGEMASSSVSDQIAFWRSGETMDATGITSQEGNNPRSFIAYAPTETKVPAKGPINLKGPKGNLAASVAPRTYRAWGSMFGGGANYLSDAGRGAAASNIGYYGGLIGVDYQIQPNILVGVALGG